ncbi:hypothetical protein BLNAU_18631 [Blattamonas nauphoetae]|uniref:Bromo domain-containing protein n=1 Tax=Blattamonas nauphoetae TaxID=2049346 RepID=A0ABQ9X749_9EUKA|nr:hypothetical protein BLNAU_18631 [Blattamonas nauphoetae]
MPKDVNGEGSTALSPGRSHTFEDNDADPGNSGALQITQSLPVNFEFSAQRFAFFKRLAKDLIHHRDGGPFSSPVDVETLKIPQYFDIIKHPMDLGTIYNRLDTGAYEYAVDAVISDFVLVFDNCFHFNPPFTPVSEMGEGLYKLMLRRMENSKLFTPEQMALASGTDVYKYHKDPSIEGYDDPGPRSKTESRAKGRGGDRSGAALRIPRIKPVLDDLLIHHEEEIEEFTLTETEALFLKINMLPDHFHETIMEFIIQTCPYVLVEYDNENLDINLDRLPREVLRRLQEYVDECFNVIQQAGFQPQPISAPQASQLAS